jgi:hypothetical protein
VQEHVASKPWRRSVRAKDDAVLRHRYRIASLPDAYTRVTNPERFRPLHDLGLTIAGRLRSGFEVEESHAFELLPERMRPFEHARPPVTLTPLDRNSAPLAIAFTPFPSLLVRCGHWHIASFPNCGCDACAATAAEEGRRFEQLVGDVVAGRFTEEVRISFLGAVRLRWWLGDAAAGDGHQGAGMMKLPRGQARAMRAGGSRLVRWRAWRRAT